MSAKVACDAKNIYFYVRTQDALTPHTASNWMQLLIDADLNPKTGWNGYDFVVNSRVISATTTTLKRLPDGRTWPVHYRAAGSELAVTVPRALLGLTNTYKTTFDFHWVDNAPVGGDPKQIADWWYVGDSAPDGRLQLPLRQYHPALNREGNPYDQYNSLPPRRDRPACRRVRQRRSYANSRRTASARRRDAGDAARGAAPASPDAAHRPCHL